MVVLSFWPMVTHCGQVAFVESFVHAHHHEEPAGEWLVPRRHCLLSLESFGCPPSTPSGLWDTSVGSGALHPPRLLPQALGQGTNLSAHPQGQDSVGETRTCSPGPRISGLITCRGGFRGPGILLHLLGGPWRPPHRGAWHTGLLQVPADQAPIGAQPGGESTRCGGARPWRCCRCRPGEAREERGEERAEHSITCPVHRPT